MTDNIRRAGIYVEKDERWDTDGWTAVPNAILRHPQLSWEAKGAFAWLSSHSKTFALRAEDLAEAGPKGRNHAREMLRELEQHGWLTRRKERNAETGRYDVHIYRLHPQPVPIARRTFVPSTAQKRSNLPPAPVRAGAGAAEPAGDQNPRPDPATARTGAGRPGAGEPGAGRTGPYKKTTEEEPPQPPASRGEPEPPDDEHGEVEPCAAHGRRSCRTCGTSPRARQWAERDAAAAELERRERRGRACAMCIPDGPARDGGTRWLRVLPGTQEPVTPYLTCDHESKHAEVMARIAADEANLERPAQAEREFREFSSSEARQRAREAMRRSSGTSRKVPKPCQPSGRGRDGSSRATRPGEPNSDPAGVSFVDKSA